MADFRFDIPDGAVPPPRDEASEGTRNGRNTWDMPLPPVEPLERRGGAPRFRWSSWLLRSTWLLVHGETGLTPTARKNLATAAFLLSALWFVDVLAWFGLWNLLLTRSVMRIEPLSALALILGVLIATAVLFYESSFITADLRRSSKPVVSITIRLGLIAVVSMITSLPVDMYLLDDQINRRVHEEQVLQQLSDVLRRMGNARQRGGLEGTSATKAAEDAAVVEEKNTVDAADTKQAQSEAAWRSARQNLNLQQAQVAKLEAELAQVTDAGEIARRSQMVRRAENVRDQLVRVERQAANTLKTAQQEQASAKLALTKKLAGLKARRIADAEQESGRHEAWIHDLWNAAPRTYVVERGNLQDGRTYDGDGSEAKVGIGERLIVLTDLLQANPPRRPRMREQDRDALQKIGLGAFVKEDREGAQRKQEEAKALHRLVVVSLVGFAFLPIMVLALKFLFDEDTRRYLDSRYQRRIGNVDAQAAPDDDDPATAAM